MAWYAAVFLGLVQGVCEFLPVSSSGHLLLFEHLFGLSDGGLLFNIILHMATLLAVVFVYRKRLLELIKKPFCKYNLMLFAATAVTCLFVVLFKDLIDAVFTVKALPFAFITTAVVLLLPWLIKPKENSRQWVHTMAAGVAQGVAVVPGFSRSGFTITAGQLAGAGRESAADFSFLMSVPVIIASLVYEMLSGGQIVDVGFGNVIIAFITAFVSGIFAIKFMLAVIKKIDLRWFSLYLFALGVILFIYGFGFKMF